MTAAPASPQQIRDRLLQAIDPQSNIRNMVAVLEVISSLEKYPITKEALEETRLGKLINDVRKKTKNEELAKRAKKLLRSWQKLIEPVHQNEAALRGLAGAPGSANGGAHNCRPETGMASVPKSIHDLKNRNDIQRLPGQRLDRLGSRKRRGDQRDLGHPGPPPKVSKASHDSLVPNSSPLPIAAPSVPGTHGTRAPLPGSGAHTHPRALCLAPRRGPSHLTLRRCHHRCRWPSHPRPLCSGLSCCPAQRALCAGWSSLRATKGWWGQAVRQDRPRPSLFFPELASPRIPPELTATRLPLVARTAKRRRGTGLVTIQ
uniref:Mediator of RNA polymerase II transcription subunit 26 n=1 Tax=Rousettus aegyptiacus TaxID=9407 RepID=A0A7J8BTA6_ROUAE|nr:hypothetical protein HJG63_009588 [Rousettus aegyptiacus]